jgi:diguanylate cyclase (GGDEF)-like protein
MREQLQVLLIDDDPQLVERLRSELRRLDPAMIQRAHTPDDVSASLNEGRWDIVLTADRLAQMTFVEVLRLVASRDPDLPVIVLASMQGEEAAVASIKAGAADHILRTDLARLDDAVVREMKDATTHRARRRAEAKLEHLAMHDGLTELPNRRLFEDRLASALKAAARERHGVVLMSMDLNGFKPVNDTFGHHAGDLLLRLVGGRLREALRESDTVARLGGDEFGVLVPKLEGPPIVPPQLISRLLAAFDEPFKIEGVDVNVGISIGIALYPHHAPDAETLFRHADIAMYTAKRAKTPYEIYDASRDQYSRDRMSLVDDLRKAIDRRQLILYYQPVVELRTGLCSDVEALVRWQHPERGMIAPNEFLPMFERLRLMRDLSSWAIETALRQSTAWRQEGLELDVTVNLAAQNLADAELARGVRDAIDRSGAPARRLFLEVPEAVIMADPERAGRAIDELGTIGIRFAIDDFGTGFSSLAYLDKLKADRLKVDRSFVAGSGRNERSAIVRAATELGHTLGFDVLAVGIEDADDCARVIANGCELGQGYHFAPPMPAANVPAWVAARTAMGPCEHAVTSAYTREKAGAALS